MPGKRFTTDINALFGLLTATPPIEPHESD
jgi:hypothetical protein